VERFGYRKPFGRPQFHIGKNDAVAAETALRANPFLGLFV
jgi:hypothetical protein